MKLIKDLGMLYPNISSKRKSRYGLYVCPKCTKEFRSPVDSVKRGHTTKCRSCGSSHSGPRKYIARTHGMCRHPLYTIWNSMQARCHNKTSHAYNLYGAKGIKVCRQWLDNPQIFIKWAEANGWKEGLQIDKDELSYSLGVNPPIYSPETCQFVTKQRNIEIREELNARL